MPKKFTFWKMLRVYNIRKGYNRSIRKAVVKALEEEESNFNTTNQLMISFMIYVLVRAYIRYYKWFTKNIHFRTGKSKFILYSLEMFIPQEGRSAFEDIKNELDNINKEFKIRRK